VPSEDLSVFLNEYFVGVLTQLPDGRMFFSFGESYLRDEDRPTLSLSYKNILNDLQRNVPPPSFALPPFFANLLPEGKLRKYLAEKSNVKETQEFRLLEALKDDLPGAVILKPDRFPQGAATSGADNQDATLNTIDGPLRFSLAGIQMKLSGDLTGSKIVIPARGVGGHWIVKLPSPSYDYINELEYSMLHLASQIGITVPEFKLVPAADLENLPHNLRDSIEGNCLISRRFDRTTDSGRIHTEDFAQVFNLLDKYNLTYNYQSIANVLWIENGLDAVLEFVKRLVHMILTGNADMHLKNWSLIYPDGRHPKLSPAYDFVSTAVYPDIDRSLPHKLAGERDFQKIDVDTFKVFAQIAKLPERAIVNTVTETVDLTKYHWSRLRHDLPMPSSYYRVIDEHMQALPLFKEHQTQR
jgi:serine/threonine-protein kinase HipA